jgi:hypothetical protein
MFRSQCSKIQNLEVFLYSIFRKFIRYVNPNDALKQRKLGGFFNFLEKFIKDMFDRTMPLKYSKKT